MKAVHRAIVALSVVTLLMATTRAESQAPARADTLIVGTYAYGTVDRAGAIAPLTAFLGERLHRPARVFVAPDPVALSEATRAGRVDVVVTNTFGYLLLAEGADGAEAVATFRVPPGVRTNYSAVLVSRSDTLRSWAQLQRAAATVRLTFVSPGSTTGNLVPRLMLASKQLADPERQMRGVHYAGTHAAAFDALQRGEADVAALATEEFTRQRQRLDATERTRYHVLWESPDIMLGPVAVRRGVRGALRDSIAALLPRLASEAPQAFAALRGGWTEARVSDALVAATDRSYDAVRRLFGQDASTTALIRRLSK